MAEDIEAGGLTWDDAADLVPGPDGILLIVSGNVIPIVSGIVVEAEDDVIGVHCVVLSVGGDITV